MWLLNVTNLLTRHLSSLRSVPWHYWNSFSSFVIVRNLQKSFRGETVSGVAKWRLFSQVTFSSLFIAFPLTENNVVLSWFTKVIPSSLWRNDGPVGNWHGNCTLMPRYPVGNGRSGEAWVTCVHHQIIPRTIAPPMILITKSSSSSVVWRIYGVLPGAALTPPVESMSEMGSNIPVTLIPKSEIWSLSHESWREL